MPQQEVRPGAPYGSTARLSTLLSSPAAAVAAEQARLVGSLQHPLVVRDYPRAAAALRALAPTYERLRAALT